MSARGGARVGTGLAPFLSLIKDPDIDERFDNVVLIHGCRNTSDFAYCEIITRELPEHELPGDLVRAIDRLSDGHPRTLPQSRPAHRPDRIGKLFDDPGLPAMDRENDRFILCGSPGMLTDTKTLPVDAGFVEGSACLPGDHAIEKAFVEK